MNEVLKGTICGGQSPGEDKVGVQVMMGKVVGRQSKRPPSKSEGVIHLRAGGKRKYDPGKASTGSLTLKR